MMFEHVFSVNLYMTVPVELSSSCKRQQSAFKKNKGKLICETDQIDSGKWLDVPKENCLATIDILLDVEVYQKGCNKLVYLLQNGQLNMMNLMVKHLANII